MLGNKFRYWIDRLRDTPLHPQWLLGNRREITSRIKNMSTGQVLDIGCADRWVEKVLPVNCKYMGIDYLATGKLMYGARPDVFADAASIPVKSESIDTVVVLEVVEHLRSPGEAFSEMERVLCKGGCVLLSVPFIYPIHDAPHDYQRYTVHGLMREFKVVGLHVEEIVPSLRSAQTAGLIVCLSLAGMLMEAARKRNAGVLLAPVLVAAIPLVNLISWAIGNILPSWSAITAGYIVVARKP